MANCASAVPAARKLRMSLAPPNPRNPLQVVQPGQLEALPFKPPAFAEHLVQIFLATIQVGRAA